MNQAEATEILRRLETSIAKSRSVLMETLGVDDPDEDSIGMNILRDLNPWLFGEGSVLVPLHRLNERVRKGEALTPSDFVNIMWVAEREMAIQVGYAGQGWGELPNPRDLSPAKWDSDEPELTELQKEVIEIVRETHTPEQLVKLNEDHQTRSESHSSIFDHPHEMTTVPMMVFGVADHPVWWMVGGTTIYDANEKEIASATPWLNGSLAIHVNGSEYAYLIHVGHALNAVFALEGIEIDAFKITGKVSGMERDSYDVRAPKEYDEPAGPVVYDVNDNSIRVGDQVVNTIPMTSEYFSMARKIYIRAYTKGVVVAIEEGDGVWVEFEKRSSVGAIEAEDRLLVFSKHLELTEFMDEGDYDDGEA